MSDRAPKRRLRRRGGGPRPPQGVSPERLRFAQGARDRGETADVIETRLRAMGMAPEEAAALADHVDLVHATDEAILADRTRGLRELSIGLLLVIVGVGLGWGWGVLGTAWESLGVRIAYYALGLGGLLACWGLHRLLRPKPRGFVRHLSR